MSGKDTEYVLDSMYCVLSVQVYPEFRMLQCSSEGLFPTLNFPSKLTLHRTCHWPGKLLTSFFHHVSAKKVIWR